MSNIFGKLSTEGLEQSTDRLGGFAPVSSGIYIATIKALYAGQSAGGAMSVSLIADLEGADREYKETFYVTNKNGENYFVNKNDKTKKVPLPGFTVVDDICLIATGESLAQQTTEEKVINIYDFEAKKEQPKSVQMLMGAIGQKVALGIVKQIVNKQEKNSAGEYVPVADTREENVVEKVFHPEMKLTVAEARNGQTEAKFWDAWKDRNTDVVRDKRTIKDGQGGSSAPPKPGQKPAPGAPASQPARKSLFAR